MDRWTPSGAGADFKLSPILKSLEPYKRYVTSFGNLQNQAMVGGVHSLAPATWLSGMRPDRASAGASMSTTLDQVVAQRIGQDTTMPSLELAAETTQQSAACSGSACFYNTTLSFRDEHSPLPMEYNPARSSRSCSRRRHAEGAGLDCEPDEKPLDRITSRTRALRQDWVRAIAQSWTTTWRRVREIERRVQLASSRDLSAIEVPQAPIGELDASTSRSICSSI